MGFARTILMFCLVFSLCSAQESSIFLLKESKQIVKTSAGEMRVLRGEKVIDKPLLIGFIIMEPKSLFIPQYLDSAMILFIRRGEAKIGTIYKDKLVEKRLKMGDLYAIQAGSAFYLMNTEEGQRLHIICSTNDPFQSFFLGGGKHPTSVLAGFKHETLSAALNVSVGDVRELIEKKQDGAIIYTQSHLVNQGRADSEGNGEDEDNSSSESNWIWRKLLHRFVAKEKKQVKEPDAYNLYERMPDFKNDYGWSIALDESDYSPLGKSGIGVYLVNLTAGSMMVPHMNPTATEYGVVLSGSGSVEMVYPNGSMGVKSEVKEGDVFWVPRYFAFCQIASRTGPMEFFGFTSSAEANRPVFLVGGNSLLSNVRGPEMAAAFGVGEKTMERVTHAQRETVIVPSRFASPADSVFVD